MFVHLVSSVFFSMARRTATRTVDVEEEYGRRRRASLHKNQIHWHFLIAPRQGPKGASKPDFCVKPCPLHLATLHSGAACLRACGMPAPHQNENQQGDI
jgi:hypothetical protein